MVVILLDVGEEIVNAAQYVAQYFANAKKDLIAYPLKKHIIN